MKEGKVTIGWIVFIVVLAVLAGFAIVESISMGNTKWYWWACYVVAIVNTLVDLANVIRHLIAGNIYRKPVVSQTENEAISEAVNESKVIAVLFLFTLLGIVPASAQIHQAGQTTLEISGGLVDGFRLPGRDNFGTFGGLAYSKYKSINTYWKAGVHLNQKFYAYDKAFVPVSQWLVEGTYFTRVMGLINKSWVVNVGGGIAGGYESINQDGSDIKGATIMNRSEWVVGPTLAIEGEYILTGRTILIARVQEYYLFRSNIIPTRFNLGIGVKFILDTDSEYK